MLSVVKCSFYPLHLIVVLIIYTLVPEIDSYSKVSKSGAFASGENITNDDLTQIHKQLNVNIVFPEKFNTTTFENSSMDFSGQANEPMETRQYIDTGRAATDRTRTFPFNFVNSMNPRKQAINSRLQLETTRKPDGLYPVYWPPLVPSRVELDKIRGKGEAMDRFTPGEAVATAQFKNKPAYYYNRPQKQSFSPQPSKPIQSPLQSGPYSYAPSLSFSQGLYAFPPNLNSNYPPTMVSGNNSKNNPKQIISSYSPPPAGPIVDTLNTGFTGPVSPEYLPPNLQNSAMNLDNSEVIQQMSDTKIEMMKSPPKEESVENYEHNHSYTHSDKEHEYHTPPSNFYNENGFHESSPEHAENDMIPMPITMNDSPKMLPNNSPLSDHDEHENEHEHGHDLKQTIWNSLPSFYGSHGIDSRPEIIFDHHPPFDHYDDHHPPPTTTTERPEQPRVKKYSYFYLGRKLWYIPLYFTVWFSFYILFLIIKSIARHKVDLPNHYKERRAIEMRQSFIDTQEVDRLTAAIMTTIEDFKEKYF